MAIYDGDQQAGGTLCISGVHVSAQSAAAIKAATPAAFTAYTFTAAFNCNLRGSHMTYRKGQTYMLAAADVTALTGLSAPMTAA